MRLLSVVQRSDFALPDEMLKEIEANSREGADSEWQISNMKKNLDLRSSALGDGAAERGRAGSMFRRPVLRCIRTVFKVSYAREIGSATVRSI